MALLLLVTAVALLIAYRTYGALLPRLFRVDDSNPTPAVLQRDDKDFVPTEPKFLLGQHFSAIAAAGPIVGPILAGIMFGWLPALLWILVGSVFIGGVHDFSALIASVRHKARSIAEVVRDHMNRRVYILFLSFIWLALLYIIVAFTDVTASAFVGLKPLPGGGNVNGAGIATSSALYLVLPLAMGLLLRFTKISLGWATAIFLPLVLLAIWIGQHAPLDLASMLDVPPASAQRIWGIAILAYCFIAAVIPMWLLLQPRGHLGGYFLYAFLIVGTLGLLFGGRTIQYPAFLGWEPKDGKTLAPILFITIACGAVSGFHSLIASGTTSKQLRRESDARPIGYGAMMLEAGVAVLSLSCVMMLARGNETLSKEPNLVFATGIGGFLSQVGIPQVFAVSIMMMAFATFVYDTLDVCTRLGRYIIQELTGWHSRNGMWLGTALTASVPLVMLLFASTATDPTGKPIPAWRLFWELFGASNQLLAALTLLGVTVWLWRSRRATWALFVTGLPCAFMYCMSCWALISILSSARQTAGIGPVFWVAVVLMILAGWMLVEAVALLLSRAGPRAPEPLPAAA